MLLAIDPGTTKSAYIVLSEDRVPEEFALLPNEDLLEKLPTIVAREMAIEMIASYGMPVGITTFETVLWIGRFIERWKMSGRSHTLVYRTHVKEVLNKSGKGNDSTIRQALIDRYGPTKTEAIGTKESPGPLYGIKKDIWSALAVGVTHFERSGE